MADNPGAYPLDPASAVGKFRLSIGDTQSIPFDPVQAGLQNYTFLSDAEIEQFIAMGGDSTNRAIGYWQLQLANMAALEARAIKDYDLQISTEKRAADLRANAAMYFGLADDDDNNAGLNEAFEIVPTTTEYYPLQPEAAPWPFADEWPS